jgi:diguanylate cyclase (GGDEF)-like protein/PAS domain S-box-containing protein
MNKNTVQLNRYERIIQTLTQIAQSDSDLDQFMQLVVDNLQVLTAAKGTVVELVDGNCMVYRCTSRSMAQFVGTRLQRANSLSGLCVATAQVLRCDDADADARVDREACRRIGVRSMVCTPLFQAGRPVGVLKVMSEQANFFSEEDVQTLGLMAGALGAALGRQILFDAVVRAKEQLRASEARVRAMLANASDAVISMNEAGCVTQWNQSAQALFGWRVDEAMGRSVAELIIPPQMRERHLAGLKRFIAAGAGEHINKRLEMPALDRNGRELLVELSLSATRLGEHWEFTAFLHDISERNRLLNALKDMALTDGLTGLVNRRGFMETVDTAIARARRHGHTLALLYMDLNGFKQINDEHGHHVGDLALREFANRVSQCVRKTDTVSRLGGDEFTVLAEAIEKPEQALALAHKIMLAMEPPVPETGIVLATSIGICLYEDAADASSFLLDADKAMYRAKHVAKRLELARGHVVSHCVGAWEAP